MMLRCLLVSLTEEDTMGRKMLRGRRGAGMTEYIIIVFLIGIGAIGVVSIMGDNIRALFATGGNALAGEENAPAMTQMSQYKHWTLKGGELYAAGGSGSANSDGDGGGGGGVDLGDFGIGTDGNWGGSGDSPTMDNFDD
jgi:Flp pilus assembly pilin Flp